MQRDFKQLCLHKKIATTFCMCSVTWLSWQGGLYEHIHEETEPGLPVSASPLQCNSSEPPNRETVRALCLCLLSSKNAEEIPRHLARGTKPKHEMKWCRKCGKQRSVEESCVLFQTWFVPLIDMENKQNKHSLKTWACAKWWKTRTAANDWWFVSYIV